ncbi:hypothetical protein CDAR_239591 [Caerostris darwini]|uniref:Uncharacterized protein n=1 Tax=Caerostris darwini TaxID=1538125 RepID=A0AAV4SV74_9ARAC|nr:hypothetical protein CDAR_239591 [Caerostris darwini]
MLVKYLPKSLVEFQEIPRTSHDYPNKTCRVLTSSSLKEETNLLTSEQKKKTEKSPHQPNQFPWILMEFETRRDQELQTKNVFPALLRVELLSTNSKTLNLWETRTWTARNLHYPPFFMIS